MARCLIVGCGCRGSELARELHAHGHIARGTTRRPEQLAVIEAAGAEAVLADPDRIGTLVAALDHTSVVVLLLGSARGPADRVEALHGPRLETLLTKVLDTTVRGIVYEASGTVERAWLAAGADLVARVCAESRIPFAFLEVAPTAPDWLQCAVAVVEGVLTSS